MLEFFRKHKGAFLITLTVIIIISFSLWGGWKGGADREAINTNATAFKIYGDDYTIAEAQRIGRLQQPIQMLRMIELYISLMSLAQDPAAEGGDFIFNLLVLRHEMEKAGIHPSDADARAELEKLPALQENGVFNLQRAQIVEANLGMYGLSGEDLLEVVKLKLGLDALQALVSKNYVPSPFLVEKSYANQYQTLKLATIAFQLDDYKKDVKVTDEQIQKYYDENKDSYKTEEQRAITYVLFEEPKDLDKKPLEGREAAQNKFSQEVSAFYNKTMQHDLAKAAAEAKLTMQTLPAFPRSAPPEAIKNDGELVEAIFNFNRATGIASDPVKGAKGYYLFTVTAIQAPQQQELVAVKDKIRDTLVTQGAREAMEKAVNDARAALAEGLKAGKKIEDLAKDKKLTVSAITDFDPASPPQTIPNAYQIAPEAQATPPGELTKVLDTETGAMLVYVHSKELRKRDDSAALRKNSEETAARQERDRIFGAWFSRKRQEANVQLGKRPA